MTKVYVVQVMPEASLGRVSQEGYTSLEKKRRPSSRAVRTSPRKSRPGCTRSTDGNDTDYLIYEVRVV